MTSFLGKKISLISKAGIRYEGILYTIDPTESTVALSKVKSFGTEDRIAERFIPPRDEVYEYIIFRGTDIRDLHVCENSLYSEDSAIVKIMSPNFSNQSPLHVAMPQHGLDAAAPPDLHQNSQDRSPAAFNAKPMNQKDSRGLKNSSSGHPKSSERDRDSSNLFDPKPLQQTPLSQQDLGGDRDPRKADNFDMDKIATNDYHNFLNRYDTFHSEDEGRDYSTNYRRGGGGTGNSQRQRGVKHSDGGRRGASQFNTGGGNGIPTSRAYRMHSREVTVELIRDDFDFETSNALLELELAQLDVTAAVGNHEDGRAGGGGGGKELSDTATSDCGDEKPQYYNKTLSFFDSISSEMTERTNSDRRNERRSNTETFGDSNYGRGGGGRGSRWGNRRGQFRGNYNRASSAGFLRRGSYFNRGESRGRGPIAGSNANKRLISVGGNRGNGNEN